MFTPLVSSVKTQVEELQSIGIKAVNLANEELDAKEVEEGKFDMLFATPETWIKDEKWCAMLESDYYRSATLFIVADEAHCVHQWLVFTIIWVKILEQQRLSYDQLVEFSH